MRPRPPALGVLAVPLLLAVLTTAGCSDGGWSSPIEALRSSTTSEASSAPDGAAPSSSAASGPAASGPSAAGPAASSSVAATVQGTPAPTPSATMSIAVLVPPDLVPASGYRYVKAPSAVVSAFAPVAAGYRGVLSAPTVRGVQRDGSGVGSVAAMTVEASHLRDREVVNALLTGLVKGISGKGYTLRTRSVTAAGHQHDVVVAFAKGSTIAAWLHEGAVVTLVTSDDEGPVLAFAKAYLAG